VTADAASLGRGVFPRGPIAIARERIRTSAGVTRDSISRARDFALSSRNLPWRDHYLWRYNTAASASAWAPRSRAREAAGYCGRANWSEETASAGALEPPAAIDNGNHWILAIIPRARLQNVAVRKATTSNRPRSG